MAQRPTFVDIQADGTEVRRPSTSGGLPSPRIMHVAGDVPPAMSPLDAFAAQSRLLAKQLEETKNNGRRASRLPPIAVASSLAKQRPGYFRSLTTDAREDMRGGQVRPVQEEDSEVRMGRPGEKMEVESPGFRPRSFYLRMSTASPVPGQHAPQPSPLAHEHPFSTPTENRPSSRGDYFGAARAHSPESMAPPRKSYESAERSSPNKSLTRDLSLESNSSRGAYSHGLLRPNPPYARQTPSIRSVTVDSSDDENSGFTPGSSISQERKLSESSGFSMPQSPISPFMAPPYIRSPSAHSDYSVGGSRLSRPRFNFSRPLSRSSQPSMEFPIRQSSHDSQPTRPSVEEPVQTPSSLESQEVSDPPEEQLPAVPYIYAKYSLPRGRMLGRNSIPLENIMPMFEWETPTRQRTPGVDSSLQTPPHSIESERPILDSAERVPADSNDSKYLPRSPERPPVDSHDSRFVGPPVTSSVANLHRHSMTSVNSGSTIKAPQRATADLTAEDHLTKGIDLHERGSLKESTYHLRIAARQNNPTAMLLYALACRHGWGMRQNPKEGVQWLRKAMDYASLELENDHNAASRGRQGDVSERKTRRAQFALSVYELGVSHMNGWGIEQDKALALRCFEIASDWGDADAMAEAGFCYAQGVGCKKDLKKAARYYRSAEAKGMSMVGNSWYVETRLFNMIFRSADDVCIRIYKPKYASDSEERSGRSKSTAPEKEKKPRDKSRTRTLFGRKRSNTQAAPST
jgi:TPR repeat protein